MSGSDDLPTTPFSLIYPFSAIVGQDLMKKALVLNAVNPRIGGVLIKGERGTSKSTAVRALGALLPEQTVISGCPYGCDPRFPGTMCSECLSRKDRRSALRKMRVVELPVSATEDKVVGSLDMTSAIKAGSCTFEPGILAEANRNILYVDEVNLLNDHIVDVLLDVAAMGVNIVEREGISFVHPSSFILVGTLNPEEGDLRPQLLDRFGLCVEVDGLDDPELRMSVLKRRMEFEADPSKFMGQWREEDTKVSSTIISAKELLPYVVVPEHALELIVRLCIDAHVDGHRGDITMMRTSMTIAAYEGRAEVSEDDVREAADLVLKHRTNSPPKDEPKKEDEQEKHSDKHEQNHGRSDSPKMPPKEPQQDGESDVEPTGTTQFSPGETYKVKSSLMTSQLRMDHKIRERAGRRNDTESPSGRYVGSMVPRGEPRTIALDATIRAASVHQVAREGRMMINIEPQDVREKVLERKVGNLLVFVVDASGSMGARQRMTAVKGAILSLLIDAYQKRDRVCLVVFRGDHAEAVVPPTNSVALAQERMGLIPTGGRTPLGDGLSLAHDIVMKERRSGSDLEPLIVLITDGRGNVSRTDRKPMEEVSAIAHRLSEEKVRSLVIDSEEGMVSLGCARKLASDMEARYMKLEDIRSDTVLEAMKGLMP
jgi:magnesium chelatase subunit D